MLCIPVSSYLHYTTTSTQLISLLVSTLFMTNAEPTWTDLDKKKLFQDKYLGNNLKKKNLDEFQEPQSSRGKLTIFNSGFTAFGKQNHSL